MLGKMRALIVDDEPLARRVLREEMEAMAGVEVAGEAEDGQSALVQIATLQPDVVFLDIQMPGMSGFDVVRSFGGGAQMPVIIFVTAFDQHAIQAFEEGAIDYLLKPVSQQRLEKALEKARKLARNEAENAETVARLQEVAKPEEAQAGQAGGKKQRRIVGKHGREYYLLNAEEVLAFQAEGELVWIITHKQRLLATQSLRAIQEKLVGMNFQRVHRNALVNLDHVRKMSALSSQRWLLTLSNNQEFTVSKRQAGAVEGVLNW
jgi:two-component system, LytTR family, response regulator